MRPSSVNFARLGCLTLVLAAAACGGDSGGPPSPPRIEASVATTQTANAGSVVASPTVRVGREDGSAIARAVVTFSISGGGTIAAMVDTTDASGIATAGQWRLPNAPATSTVTATTPSAPGSSVVFTATGQVGPAASLTKTTGENQFKQPGEMVSPRPSVTVRDAVGNPVAGVTVTFAVIAGGGSATGLVQTTDANGVATVGSWTLGTTAGQNRLTATIAGGQAVTFMNTVIAPALVTLRAGDNQNAEPGQAVAVAPSVTVLDNLNAPVAGVTVTFTVASGGGTVTGATVVTDASGVATVGSWILGGLGDNRLTATVTSLAPVTFLAVSSGYNLDLRFRTSLTVRQRLAFERAMLKWSRVLTGDIPGVVVTVVASPSGCYPALTNEPIDDLVIYVDVGPIDGVNGTLAQAGPCLVRQTTRLSAVGRMTFDIADIDRLETVGTIDDVILHEMGHVLGVGTLWQEDAFPGLLVGAGTADPYFTGANARAAFAAAGGGTYPGNPVPVENTGGAGTRDGHWREVVLRTELMTGFISAAGNPLSAITIGSLRDIGYVVNLGAADPYTVPAPLAIVGDQPQEMELREILLRDPDVLGADGRIIPKGRR